jgi:hypothetical protein
MPRESVLSPTLSPTATSLLQLCVDELNIYDIELGSIYVGKAPGY